MSIQASQKPMTLIGYLEQLWFWNTFNRPQASLSSFALSDRGMMQTKEDIFAAIKNILVKEFELDASQIHLDSRLYEDLDLDSIDAIDMILQLQNLAGENITSEEFKKVKVIRDAVDVLYRQLNR